MINLDPDHNIISNLRDGYAWTIFGGIGGDDLDKYTMASIPIIFGTLIITVILLNILIAFLSNVFSRLEEQQSINNLKEKASMIIDMEIIIHFYKYKLSGLARKFKRYDRSQESLFIKSMNPEFKETVILY